VLTDDELAAIEARCEAATAGPWDCDEHTMLIYARDEGVVAVVDHHRANVSFIAAARSDVPALLAEVRRLRAFNAKILKGKSWVDGDEGLYKVIDRASYDLGYEEGGRSEAASYEAVHDEQGHCCKACRYLYERGESDDVKRLNKEVERLKKDDEYRRQKLIRQSAFASDMDSPADEVYDKEPE
jgi:hypothetical protein